MTSGVGEPDEIAKDDFIQHQSEAERSAVLEVLLHLCSQRAAVSRGHWRSPGHGMATRESVCRSTFA